MTEYFKVISGVLLAVVLCLCLGKQSKDLSTILAVAVCCMVMAAAASLLDPLIQFIQRLQSSAGLDSGVLEVLLKAVGIGLIGEFASLICQDSGYGSMGKGIQVLTTAAVLWLSLPLMESLLEVINQILEGI